MSDTTWTWPNSLITNVIDGDTIDARVRRDMGFGGTAEFIVRLRLNRINTPAKNTTAGKAAKAAVETLRGQTVHIQTLKPYKFSGPDTSPGEWMAEVTTSGGVNLSDLLMELGHAVYWNGQGPRPADGDTPESSRLT